MGDRLLTVLQAAEEFNLTTSLLYKAVERHELRAVRFKARGRIRLQPRDIESWIRGHGLGAAAEPGSHTNESSPSSALAALLPSPDARKFA